jgi:DNA helicase-2/ATP-dependent DNA helicase PcrA
VVLQDVVDSGAQVSVWAEPPASDAVNPLRSSGQPVPWPVPTTPDPAVQAAAGLVRTADVAARPESAVALEWRARAELLLAERAAAGVLAEVEVSLPAQLSVSTVVQLRRDPLALARALRRPMPQRPSPAARRGTDFHAWLEHRFGQGELLDVEDLPGSADDSAPSATLTELQAAFQRSPWWARRPHAVEVPFELRLAGVTMRGRVDAVFADDDGGWTIVDWKTGDRPEGAELAVVATQLGVYRIAWARLADCGVDRVRAAFHYVAFEQTVWLHDLVDEAELARLVESVPVG